jgi:predicted flap endonuclease-1-like 5' DNA nuclease
MNSLAAVTREDFAYANKQLKTRIRALMREVREQDEALAELRAQLTKEVNDHE